MQKLSLIPLILIATLGAVWATTIIFPNTTEFPRSPGGVGTLSGALALFGSDGSATNALQLGDKTASGYLQNRDCSSEIINTIWVGIDASGGAICGSRGVLVGNYTEGSNMSVKRGAAAWQILSPNDPLYAGDIVQTTSVGTGTIQFALDESILRLDQSTTVELSIGSLGGQSVAQAILSDGRLWGRILTSTGVNLGGGGLVAGVRGTSVNIVKNSTQYTITIIDSQQSIAATIQNSNNSLTTGNMVSSGVLLTYTSGSTSTPLTMPAIASRSKTTALSDNWIRTNTLADIDYMATTLSGSSDTIVISRLNSEIDATLPIDPTIIGALVLPTGGGLGDNNTNATLSGDTVISQTNTMVGPNSLNRQYYFARIVGCTTKNKTYWRTIDNCQENNLIAFADYKGSITDTTFYVKNGGTSSPIIPSGGPRPFGPDNGISITMSGQYLSYPINDLPNLSGKTITIELVAAIPITSNDKYYVLDLGNEMGTSKTIRYYIQYGSVKCSYRSYSACQSGDFIKISDVKYQIKIPATPTQMIIGNQSFIDPVTLAISYPWPISTSIKNIRIQSMLNLN